tara:strand:- start:304 stop:489 length:186 start_codon:yes stop_codon:yes gene_type:complete
MRCLACNTELSDYEATRKSSNSNEFLDLCNTCYKSINEDIEVVDNAQNINYQDYVDFEEKL